MKRALVGFAGCLVLLMAIAVISAMRFPARVVRSEMPAASSDLREGYAERLGLAVTYPTVSLDDLTAIDWQPFLDFHAFLETSYPLVHEQLQLTKVNEHGLLYHWPGTEPSLQPVLFLAHQDVVPVSPGTEGDWTRDAFSGAIEDGYIWGRGTLDDKASLLALLESAENLLAKGFTPSRSLYLAFGQDEEVGGREGARKIAEHLESLGLRFAFVLDEGGVITESTIKGVPGLLAVIGVAEKGFVTLTLEVEGEGGHSSMPPPNTAIGILAAGLVRLETNPFPAKLEHVTRLLREIGPSVPFSQRLVMANQWLTRPLVVSMAGQSNAMNAVIRTTTAVTVAEGGDKANVLPVKASAKVNFRIMPGETVESVEARVRNVLDDSRIRIIRAGHAVNPSPISPAEGPAFDLIRDTIFQVAGPDLEIAVAPYLTLGGTDARHYTGLSQNVYRFLYAILREDDLARIHGTDERLSVSDYRSMILFYTNLFINLKQLDATP